MKRLIEVYKIFFEFYSKFPNSSAPQNQEPSSLLKTHDVKESSSRSPLDNEDSSLLVELENERVLDKWLFLEGWKPYNPTKTEKGGGNKKELLCSILWGSMLALSTTLIGYGAYKIFMKRLYRK